MGVPSSVLCPPRTIVDEDDVTPASFSEFRARLLLAVGPDGREAIEAARTLDVLQIDDPEGNAPWEVLAAESWAEPPAFIVERLIATNRCDADLPAPYVPPLTLVSVSAVQRGAHALHLDDQERRLRTLFRPMSSEAPRFHVSGATLADLQRNLIQHCPHILDISGHGDREGIHLQDAILSPGMVTSIANALCASHLRLVVLLTCSGDPIARALVGCGVPRVVAFHPRVSDVGAPVFAEAFYAELLSSGSPEQAVRSGRRALLDRGRVSDAFAVRLYKQRDAIPPTPVEPAPERPVDDGCLTLPDLAFLQFGDEPEILSTLRRHLQRCDICRERAERSAQALSDERESLRRVVLTVLSDEDLLRAAHVGRVQKTGFAHLVELGVIGRRTRHMILGQGDARAIFPGPGRTFPGSPVEAVGMGGDAVLTVEREGATRGRLTMRLGRLAPPLVPGEYLARAALPGGVQWSWRFEVLDPTAHPELARRAGALDQGEGSPQDALVLLVVGCHDAVIRWATTRSGAMPQVLLREALRARGRWEGTSAELCYANERWLAEVEQRIVAEVDGEDARGST